MQWLNFLMTNLELKFQKAQLEEHCASMNIIILEQNMPKKMLEIAVKRLDWCRKHLNKYWHNIFFIDETKVYFDNPSGFKLVKKNEKYLNANNKRRGQKLNHWELFQANGKVTIQIFKESFNKKYRDIK